MQPGQELAAITARMLTELDDLLDSHDGPTVCLHKETRRAVLSVVVSGLLPTCVPFVHVEAGLRYR